ncbi:hypothetical protein ABEB36_005619 [Hypothenemus hampei]|uniref:Gustatory receptor n=1 Tax=Hypothenemus hampei TaxID=57062 RepID=A0ABD1EYV7_HYPHA
MFKNSKVIPNTTTQKAFKKRVYKMPKAYVRDIFLLLEKKRVIYPLTATLLLLALIGHIYSLIGKPVIFHNQHVAVKTLEHVADFFLTASIVIIVLHLPKNSKWSFQFFTSLYPEGNKLFGPLLAMKKHHFWRNLFICNVCIGSLIACEASFFLLHYGWNVYKYLIFRSLEFYFYNLILMLLLTLTRKLELRFAELNELLEYKTEHFLNNRGNNKCDIQMETHLSFILNSEHFYSVRTFRVMHYELCKLVKRFNEMFGRIILSTVVFSIVNILAKVTFIIDFYITERSDEDINKWSTFIGILCFWIFVNLSQSFLFSFYGAQITKEGEKTTRICFYLLNKVSCQTKNLDEKLVQEELMAFAFQSYCHIPSLSAGGFFDINFRVLGLMISSVTSYLMVIIQFLLRTQFPQ